MELSNFRSDINLSRD